MVLRPNNRFLVYTLVDMIRPRLSLFTHMVTCSFHMFAYYYPDMYILTIAYFSVYADYIAEYTTYSALCICYYPYIHGPSTVCYP
jgi:hypothetical protein